MTKKDTKTKLMDVAEHLVRHKGADGFSYSDLSNVVGIRKASIHHHFPAKADLLTAIMQRYDQRVMDTLEGYTANGSSTAQQLRDFVSFYRDALQGGDTLCMCVAYTVTKSELAEGTQQAIGHFRNRVLSWLQQRFEEALKTGSVKNLEDPALEAASTLALVEGAQISARLNENPESFDLAVQMFLARLSET